MLLLVWLAVGIAPGVGAQPKKEDPKRRKRVVRTVKGTPKGVTVLKSKSKTTPRVNPLGKRTLGYYPRGRNKKLKVPKDVVEFTGNFKKEYKCIKLPLNLKINFDLRGANLEEVTKFMSCITGKNFIVADGSAKSKTLTILAPSKITVYEAYKAFLVALNSNALTVIDDGTFLRIINKKTMQNDLTPIIPLGQRLPDDARVVTRFISPKHVPVSEIKTLMEQFKSTDGKILEYPPTNSLIITDTAQNIRRLLKLLKIIDVPSGKERIWLRPLEHVVAEEMKDLLAKIFDTDKKKTPTPTRRRPTITYRYRYRYRRPTQTQQTTQYQAPQAVQVSKIVADARTNQLIIIATRQSYLKIDKLIRKLDVPLPEDASIHIYHLENANAEDVAKALAELSKKTTTGRTTKNVKGKKPQTNTTVASATLLGDVKITAYKPSNSLIIEASRKQYVAVKSLIEKLDVRVKQVYVEAIIMEITTDRSGQFGFSANGGYLFNYQGDQIPLLGAFGGLGLTNIDLNQLNSGGFAAGLQGPTKSVTTGGNTSTAITLSIPTFGFLLQMIQKNSDVNVLSTPHILTMDNEKAEIQVGRKIPYQAQSISGLGSLGLLGGSTTGTQLGGLTSALGSLGTLSNVKTTDVDLTLSIKPQVNESNFVRLEIDQKIDEVDSLDPFLGPTVSKRHITNKVVVKDQQSVVIGGLMKDKEAKGVNKIPFLGDIPILGLLFRQTTKTVEKKNLILIITPYIIRDPSDLNRIHRRKMEQVRKFTEQIAVRRKEYLGFIDYDKKHGVLEEIHQLVMAMRKERLLIERAKLEGQDVDNIGDPETHDLEYDPFRPRNKRRRGDRKRLQPEPIKVKPEVIDLDN
ncbi:MAG: type II secretion system secretin GspD [Myxococcales bacterium]|nr:type II secretion system secretin GspD [Myxococcales bacterium]